MRSIITIVSFLAVLSVPSVVLAYGEGADIPLDGRVIHLLTNEARSDVNAALAGCGSNCKGEDSCYEASYPGLAWDDDFYRVAQFHIDLLSFVESAMPWGCMQHDTPCKLKSDIAQNYPDKCNGDPKCACESGTAKCGSTDTSFGNRLRLFTGSAGGENIASFDPPYAVFYRWLWEDGKNSGCKFSANNGHRMNILKPEYQSMGAAANQKLSIMDLKLGTPKPIGITAGSHYSDDNNKLWFKLHYYAEAAVKSAYASIDGKCYNLKKVVGSQTNGVYGSSDISIDKKCAPYFYEVVDANGKASRYPTTGVLLYDCDKTWQESSDKSTCVPEDGGSNNDGVSDDENDSSDSGCMAIPLSTPNSGMFLIALILALFAGLGLYRRRQN